MILQFKCKKCKTRKRGDQNDGRENPVFAERQKRGGYR